MRNAGQFGHLQPAPQALDERPYTHAVRVPPVEQGSYAAQFRFTFYPDHGLRWINNRRAKDEITGWAIYTFPDEALARKFAERFGGVYVGTSASALKQKSPPSG